MTFESNTDLPDNANPTIFQSPWWLDAVCPDQWSPVAVKYSADCYAWLPIHFRQRLGCRVLGMPPLAPVLGTIVVVPDGKPSSQASQRRELVAELIGRLPRYDKFIQVFAPGSEDPFTFSIGGFNVGVTYSMSLDPCSTEEALWLGLRDKVRNLVRKGRRFFQVDSATSADVFYAFLDRNVRHRGEINRLDEGIFARAEAAAHARNASQILVARTDDGRPAAAIMVVWDRARVYYVLSTRDETLSNNSAIALLLWEAMKLARTKQLIFDFDSYGNRGGALFTSGFGGRLEQRFVVTSFSAVGAILESGRVLKSSVLRLIGRQAG